MAVLYVRRNECGSYTRVDILFFLPSPPVMPQKPPPVFFPLVFGFATEIVWGVLGVRG